ncbi:MAG TPA: type IV CRISPR-associated protein Csf3 [Nevskiaceae bacterium]|nr:type IV CRISPR-associated protein Csf3 [Nevskiaceae bacterium]
MDAIPFRVDWRVATPWCPPFHGLHLDGLVAWAMLQEAISAGAPPGEYDSVLADLPFEKSDPGHDWVWKASLLIPGDVRGYGRRFLNQHIDPDEFIHRMANGSVAGRQLGHVDQLRGPWKSSALWYTVQDVGTLTAYGVGDVERISELLERVTHLGKRTRLDHGRIEPDADGILARVQEDPEALKRWRYRNLAEPSDAYAPVVGRLRPPYWLGTGTRTVWHPLPASV